MSNYSDERLEEILSEFRDVPDDMSETMQQPAEETTDAAAETMSSNTAEEEAPAENPRGKKRPVIKLDIKGLFAALKSGEPASPAELPPFSAKSCALTAAALVIFIVAWALPTDGALRILSFAVPYLLAGAGILFAAYHDASCGKPFSAELVVSISSLIAFFIGMARDAAAVMILSSAVRLLAAYSEKRRLDVLDMLSDICPDKVRIEKEDGTERTDVVNAAVGDIMQADPGEIIALDGEVIDGMSDVDESALTGTAAPRVVGKGSMVYAGSKNLSRPLRIRVTAGCGETVAAVSCRYAADASESKAKPQLELAKISRVFTPLLLGLALIAAIVPSIITGDWLKWLGRALILAALSSPLALVRAIDLAYFGGISSALRGGIIIKGNNTLEDLAETETAVFDKTGTITEGVFDVTEISPVNMTEDELLNIAATAESCSNHPIARSLRAAGRVIEPEDGKILSIEEVPGRGISAFIGDSQVYVGNAALLEEHGIAFTVPKRPGAAIHVAVDGGYAGYIMINDRVRDSAFDALEELRAQGVKTLVMLTGDVRSAAKAVASSLNFDMVKSELPPDGKISAVEYMRSKKQQGKSLAFIGDGVDDADVMSHADVGVAMAALGSDEAIESANAVILGGDIRRLPMAVGICRHAENTVRQNIAAAAAAKIVMLLLGVFGVTPLWLAAAVDSAAMAAVMLNSLLTLQKAKEKKI